EGVRTRWHFGSLQRRSSLTSLSLCRLPREDRHYVLWPFHPEDPDALQSASRTIASSHASRNGPHRWSSAAVRAGHDGPISPSPICIRSSRSVSGGTRRPLAATAGSASPAHTPRAYSRASGG